MDDITRARRGAIEDPETLDKKSYAEGIGVTPASLGGLIGQLKSNPKMRRELEVLGYTSGQIPAWVMPLTPLSHLLLPLSLVVLLWLICPLK